MLKMVKDAVVKKNWEKEMERPKAKEWPKPSRKHHK
jgi:hypothetical protein